MKLGLVRGVDKIRSYALNHEVVYLELLGIANSFLWNVVWRRSDGDTCNIRERGPRGGTAALSSVVIRVLARRWVRVFHPSARTAAMPQLETRGRIAAR